MLYLLDANVLIDANRDYYPIERVPEFWGWLQDIGAKGLAKIPFEIYAELKEGKDDLADWVKEKDIKEALLLDEEVVQVGDVVQTGYAPDLTDSELVKLGKDPFLIAYALADLGQRCVVTTEVSKPSRSRANRHVPDVCDSLGVPWCHTFGFVRALDFSTGWASR